MPSKAEDRQYPYRSFQPQRRNAKATKRFLQRLIDRFGAPRVIITDKLRSYIKSIRNLAGSADHRAHKGLNNRIVEK